MDYFLMVAVDEARKELVVGIIDVVRTYTWDKKLESWIKDRGFAGGGRNRPTVTSPKVCFLIGILGFVLTGSRNTRAVLEKL